MKQISLILFYVVCTQYLFAQYATQNLSNLTAPTSINVALLPANNNKTNFGSPSKGWKNIYVDSAIFFNGTRFIAYKSGTGSDNTAVGYEALIENTTGSNNTATGYQALTANTTGYSNTGFGIFALYGNSTGYYNAAVGDFTMAINSTGHHNTGVGSSALNNNKTGSFNTAIGNGSMYYNTTGGWNTCLGSVVLNHNTTGVGNTAIGTAALSQSQTLSNIVSVGDSSFYLMTGGARGTALGSHAGFNVSYGADNTLVGYYAGSNINSGYSNTIVGSYANISASYYYNAMALGYNAWSTYYNQVRVGNSSVTSIGGQVGWSTFSDERVKKDIQDNVPGLRFINLLKPITYHYDIDKEASITNHKDDYTSDKKYDIAKIRFSGFSAQQVEKAAKQIDYDFSGVDAAKDDKDLYALRYSDFVVPLVKSVQELSKANDSLKNEVTELKQMVAQIQQQLSNNNISAAKANSLTAANASLQQNIPNPLVNSTTINYSLPQKFSSAQIVITDKNGKQLKQISLSGAGNGNVHVDASLFAAGTYNYTLYINGILISTKQMIVIK